MVELNFIAAAIIVQMQTAAQYSTLPEHHSIIKLLQYSTLPAAPPIIRGASVLAAGFKFTSRSLCTQLFGIVFCARSCLGLFSVNTFFEPVSCGHSFFSDSVLWRLDVFGDRFSTGPF